MQELQVRQDAIFNVSKEIKEMFKSEKDGIYSMLLKCIVQVSTKIPVYGVLVGTLSLLSSFACNSRACCHGG
jgi:hypothetical protein